MDQEELFRSGTTKLTVEKKVISRAIGADSPVTLVVTHHRDCPCCSGAGPTKYALLVGPAHPLQSELGTAHAYELSGDELDSLVKLITAPFIRRRKAPRLFCKIDTDGQPVWFNLKPKRHSQSGEYSLRVVGPGFDDMLTVSTNILRSFVDQVTEIKQRDEAILDALAEIEDREMTIKLRMKGKILDAVKNEILQADPDPVIGRDGLESGEVNVLLAAAFFVGPDVESLVSFTQCPRELIADISCRMRDSGLWANGRAIMEHWFDNNLQWEPDGLYDDFAVARGELVACQSEEGRFTHHPSGRSQGLPGRLSDASR